MRHERFNRRMVLGGLVSLVLLSFSVFYAHTVAAQGQSVFRIGVLDDERAPLTNGARLAVQQINDNGGVQGADGTFFRLQLVIQPTGFGVNLSQAVSNLNQASVIAAIGPETSEEVQNGIAALQTMNIPILIPATNDTLLNGDTSRRLIRIRAAEALQGRALADYLINGLGDHSLATLQLDVNSTDHMIGFSSAVASLGVIPQPALLLPSPDQMPQMLATLLQANPPVLVVYGSPALAATLYGGLRGAGWTGLFAYQQAADPAFTRVVPVEQLYGILATTTWPFTAIDSTSAAFLTNFVHTYGTVPGPIEAAGYDAVQLLAAAIHLPGDLLTNLAQLDNVQGVQGMLHPAQLGSGETSDNVAVVRLGVFGAPEVAARYAGSVRLPPDQSAPIAVVSSTPAPTAIPQGVIVTIKQPVQNVRTGPGLAFDVLGQVNEGDQYEVVGTTADYAWVVIQFRGQLGWLATYLLDVSGDLNTVPIIPSPATPTPGFTATPIPGVVTTAIPPSEADLIITGATVAPSPIVPNQNFTVTVGVQNIGGNPAGQFAVAATFQPNNVYTSAVVQGLGAGQSGTVTLNGILNNTGSFTVSIVMDLNNQVPEGPVGEQNNIFNFSYTVDMPILQEGSNTMNQGDQFNLEGTGDKHDVLWTTVSGQAVLQAQNGAKLGIISGISDMTQVHWDLLNPSVINQDSINQADLPVGAFIGIITADGNRGVMRVDASSASQLGVTFRVYNG